MSRDPNKHAADWEIPSKSPSPSVDEGRETGWLIERKNLGPRPFWYIEDSKGWHDWTPVAADAKRFGTREEAEAFPAYRLIANDPAISLTEHVFVASLVSPPKAGMGEAVAWVIRCDEHPLYGLVRTEDEGARYVKNLIAYAAKTYTNLEAAPLIVDPAWESKSAK